MFVIIKNKKVNKMDSYYILITTTEHFTCKLHIMLKLLTDQKENHNNNKQEKKI